MLKIRENTENDSLLLHCASCTACYCTVHLENMRNCFFFSPLESMDKVNRCIDLFLLNKLVNQPIFFIVVHESSGYLKLKVFTH